MSHEAEKYTSDLRDEQWERLHALLPWEQNGPGRPLELNMRAVVDAIFYVLRTGCQWHPVGTRLPKTYPNYQSVYYHYAKWRDNGTWQTVNEALRQAERTHQSRAAEPSAAIIVNGSGKVREIAK